MSSGGVWSIAWIKRRCFEKHKVFAGGGLFSDAGYTLISTCNVSHSLIFHTIQHQVDWLSLISASSPGFCNINHCMYGEAKDLYV